MSLMKKTMITAAAMILVVATILFFGMRKIYTPTKGDMIAEYANPAKALLVIDVQEDYTGINGRQGPLLNNVEAQIRAINTLIDSASRTGMHVVYIRQIFDNNFFTRKFIGRTLEGVPGTELDGRIRVINSNDFTKKISDAFSNPALDTFLVSNQVYELYLVGLDAAYCVYYTALGGLNRGYKVTVIEDAVMTRKDMNDVLKQYEKDGIGVSSSKKVLEMRKERGLHS
jgi:nicotinamidase/pyrazinamidase